MSPSIRGPALASLALAALFPRVSHAVCVAPTQAVQATSQQRLEGEVRATVLQFGGAVEAEKESSATWETQLPSQAGIDNQWYLYYLCREYEGGRLPRAQYCTVNAALWSRITGVPVSPDGCLAETPAAAPPPAPASAAAASHSPPVPAADTPGTPPPAAPVVAISGSGGGSAPAATGGRWSAHIPGKRSVDLYGPYRIAGTPTWYFDNLSDCVTTLRQKDGRWVEEVVAGARCSPWSQVDVVQEGGLLRVTGNGEVLEASLLEAGTTADLQGAWRGRVYPVNDIHRRQAGLKGMLGDVGLASVDRIASMDVSLRIADAGGSTRNESVGCAGTLARGSSGPGWVQYVETVDEGPCPSGAIVTVFGLSPGSLLFTWESASGSIYDGKGILHAEER